MDFGAALQLQSKIRALLADSDSPLPSQDYGAWLKMVQALEPRCAPVTRLLARERKRLAEAYSESTTKEVSFCREASVEGQLLAAFVAQDDLWFFRNVFGDKTRREYGQVVAWANLRVLGEGESPGTSWPAWHALGVKLPLVKAGCQEAWLDVLFADQRWATVRLAQLHNKPLEQTSSTS